MVLGVGELVRGLLPPALGLGLSAVELTTVDESLVMALTALLVLLVSVMCSWLNLIFFGLDSWVEKPKSSWLNLNGV